MKINALLSQVPFRIWFYLGVTIVALMLLWSYTDHQRTLGQLKEAERNTEAVVAAKNAEIKTYKLRIAALQSDLAQKSEERVVYRTKLKEVEVQGVQRIQEVGTLSGHNLWHVIGDHPRVRTP